jgi:[ribosomal protein S18]-alanine N-acetyltransferase
MTALACAVELAIAPATHADLDAIQEIERHSFPTPWPRATFEAELARDCARIVVARADHDSSRDTRGIVAFCNYWIVLDEVHILAIATHPDHRRAGIAGKLLAHVLDDGRAAGCTAATLEVRRTNQPAIALYQHAGFRGVHIRQRYYQDDGADALVMLCSLSGSRR